MVKKELIFFSAICVVGFLDWLTTVTGIFFYGATEVNPLLSGIARSNMLLFSGVKLSATLAVGFAFYQAATVIKSRTNDWQFIKNFFYCGYSVAFLMMSTLVASNLVTIFKV